MKYSFSVLLILFVSLFFLSPRSPLNAGSITERLKGRILLQVEENGEAWYLNPTDSKRYYMGRPSDAFSLMRSFGVGITNKDLSKIQISGSSSGTGIDKNFTLKQKGKILLQVESHGEAWYVYPNDGLRYYLGRPDDAFSIMRKLGLGIKNKDLSLIVSGSQESKENKTETNLSELESDVSGFNDLLEGQSDNVDQLDDSDVGFE